MQTYQSCSDLESTYSPNSSSNASKNVPSRIGGAKLQQSGCTAGVKPKRDVQTDDLEPDAGATEHTGSAHRRTYFADESYGGKGQTERVRPRTYSTA